jgi:hypothetical protein
MSVDLPIRMQTFAQWMIRFHAGSALSNHAWFFTITEVMTRSLIKSPVAFYKATAGHAGIVDMFSLVYSPDSSLSPLPIH